MPWLPCAAASLVSLASTGKCMVATEHSASPTQRDSLQRLDEDEEHSASIQTDARALVDNFITLLDGLAKRKHIKT